MTKMDLQSLSFLKEPSTILLNTKKTFGIDFSIEVTAFQEKHPLVPETDPHYIFEEEATKSLLLGFALNKRVLLQGLHGTGKSTHIEQVAARLNWPCLRINLDGHLTRSDLLGKDVIRLSDGKPYSIFQEGILPFALKHPIALVFDEYDAGRPEVLFVIQRLLEAEGKLTLLDENKILTPHPFFRMFATANTVGMGDTTGLYYGTHPLNQGQLDRWSLIAKLSYLPFEKEKGLVLTKVPFFAKTEEKSQIIHGMVAFADLTRAGFEAGDIALPMSPRSVLAWAQNAEVLGGIKEALKLTYLNRFEKQDQALLEEYYQRAFG